MSRETHGISLITHEIFCVHTELPPSDNEAFAERPGRSATEVPQKSPVWFWLGGAGALVALLQLIGK
ncbi:MAG: hypothetical protein K8R69_00220 [Deltaproteobacteria bacterium]|nr:hypothetical protein [Deltaproteobacteria bacterium]